MSLLVQYQNSGFAVLTDWRNPYTAGIHGDWRNQVRYALTNADNLEVLNSKLSRYRPYILVYSKIKVDKQEYLDLVNMDKATVCVISSSGEHLLTPWMIIHNIGHTMISWNMWIKSDIMDIIGLSSHDDSIIPIQQELVECKSSRENMIPNINELIYELFTTWVWTGTTRSRHDQLRKYCDKTFPILFKQFRGKMFWHRYRHPIPKHHNLDWLENLINDLDTVKYSPGVPGFTTKVLKTQTS